MFSTKKWPPSLKRQVQQRVNAVITSKAFRSNPSASTCCCKLQRHQKKQSNTTSWNLFWMFQNRKRMFLVKVKVCLFLLLLWGMNHCAIVGWTSLSCLHRPDLLHTYSKIYRRNGCFTWSLVIRMIYLKKIDWLRAGVWALWDVHQSHYCYTEHQRVELQYGGTHLISVRLCRSGSQNSPVNLHFSPVTQKSYFLQPTFIQKIPGKKKKERRRSSAKCIYMQNESSLKGFPGNIGSDLHKVLRNTE